MLKQIQKKLKGLTLVETLVALVVFIITIAAMTATLTAALQANQRQKTDNLAQNIASSIMSVRVWNQPFDYLYKYQDCHNNSVINQGTTLLSATVTNATPSSKICLPTKGFVSIPIVVANASISDPNTFPELSKLKNGIAEIQVYPINIGSVASPSASPDQLSVKVVVRWGDLVSNVPSNKLEVSTAVSRDGFMGSKSFPTIKPVPTVRPTGTSGPTGIPTPTSLPTPTADPCAPSTGKGTGCSCSSSGNPGICRNGNCPNGANKTCP